MIGVCIVTYNQEQFIAQCIESALAQVCSEAIRVYVANDCSLDRTGDVCRQYIDKIVLVERETNLGLVGNTMRLLSQMHKDGCDYIAMLDGDDYWCDNHKLQKQYDYMQCHPKYGLVHTNGLVLTESGLQKSKRRNVVEGDVFNIIASYPIGNNTVMFRTQLLDCINFEEFQKQGLRACDYTMYYIFSSVTEFGYLPEYTAVTRRTHESTSNSVQYEKQADYIKNAAIAETNYLAKLFPDKVQPIEDNYGLNQFINTQLFLAAFRLGDRKKAVELSSELLKNNSNYRGGVKLYICRSKWLFRFWHVVKQVMTHVRSYFMRYIKM